MLFVVKNTDEILPLYSQWSNKKIVREKIILHKCSFRYYFDTNSHQVCNKGTKL